MPATRSGRAILSELAHCRPSQIGVDDGTRTHDGRDHNPGLYQLSYVHHRNPRPRVLAPGGAPGRTRTCDPRLRRPMLYPLSYGRTAKSATRRKSALDPALRYWSGQQDLNLRPSAPKADALPDCAMPRPTATADPDGLYLQTQGDGGRDDTEAPAGRQFRPGATRYGRPGDPPGSPLRRPAGRGYGPLP